MEGNSYWIDQECRSLLLLLEEFLLTCVSESKFGEVTKNTLDVVLVLVNSCYDCRQTVIDVVEKSSDKGEYISTLSLQSSLIFYFNLGIITMISATTNATRQQKITFGRTVSTEMTFVPHPSFANSRIVTELRPGVEVTI